MPGNRRAFLFRQCWQDLSVLFICFCGLLQCGLLWPHPQPLRYELNYGRHCMFPLLLMVKVAEGVGSAPTSVVTDPVFETGAASLYLPAFHKLASRAEARGAKAGCQGWTRTNTERLNRPPCYFDTTWQWLIGAAGRSCTCIGSFRRRTPRLFRPRQRFEMARRAVAQRAKDGRSSRIFTCDLRVPGPAL